MFITLLVFPKTSLCVLFVHHVPIDIPARGSLYVVTLQFQSRDLIVILGRARKEKKKRERAPHRAAP